MDYAYSILEFFIRVTALVKRQNRTLLQTVNIPESIRLSTSTPNAAGSPTFAYSPFLNPLRNLYDKLRQSDKARKNVPAQIGCKLSTSVTLYSEDQLSES